MHFDVKSNQEKLMGMILDQAYERNRVLTKESKDKQIFLIFFYN